MEAVPPPSLYKCSTPQQLITEQKEIAKREACRFRISAKHVLNIWKGWHQTRNQSGEQDVFTSETKCQNCSFEHQKRGKEKKNSDSIDIWGTSSETKDRDTCAKFSKILVERSSSCICTLFVSSAHMLPGWIGRGPTRPWVWNGKRHGGTGLWGGGMLGVG